MGKAYFRELAEYFHSYSFTEIDEETLYQVKRALINYLGGSIYAASHNQCETLLDLILTLDSRSGSASVWGSQRPVTPMVAAFSNASRLSSLELNDGTKASAHPGIYVWSSVLANYQQYPASVEDVIRAVVFGYDICTRMAMLSIERIRELGLHNPGFVGGLGAVAATGLLRKLSVDQLCHAFGIVASLLPLCPFVSFVEGADSKDMYGGWGAFLAIFAVEAALRGLTGPESILQGVKALDTIFRGTDGKEVKPGNPFFLDNLSIKEFSACFAVNPAIKATLALRQKNVIDLAQIESVLVDTYPYSYDLNEGIGDKLNPTSARLSLPYSVATTLLNGTVCPDAFSSQSLSDHSITELMKKIETSRHDEYGDGLFGRRACIVTVKMQNGQEFSEEFDSSAKEHITTDEELKKKFYDLTSSALTQLQQDDLYQFAMTLDVQVTLDPMLNLLRLY